jgi:anti-sigma regulatory factor (Ser/Thr protein kinase)
MDDDARPRFAEISTAFPTVPESVAAARRFVAASLRRFDFSDDAVEQATLATSELVANAFGQGRPPIRIRVRSIADGRASVEVNHGVEGDPTDPDSVPAGVQLTAAGRTVVDSMASRWGSRPTGTGVVAWFEIDDPARSGATVTGSA